MGCDLERLRCSLALYLCRWRTRPWRRARARTRCVSRPPR